MLNFRKKIITGAIVLAATLFTNHVSAQSYYTGTNNTEEKNFKLGLSINPNIGWLRFDDSDYSNSAKIGFSYGLLADLGFAKNYYFSTGLLINAINAEMTTPTERKDIRLTYVDIPLTLKLKSEENESGRFYGQFGITAGFNVSGRETIEGNKKNIANDNLLRLGLQLGAGKEWKINDNLNLMTGLSFNNGFTRAFKEGKPKTSFMALNVGIFF